MALFFLFLIINNIKHMKKSAIAVLMAGSLAVSCQNHQVYQEPTNAPAQNSPVETKKPNTDYKPAFAGQTRAPGVKTQTSYKFEILNTGLGRPWGIINLPDGRFLVTEKSGFIYLLSKEGTTVNKITGLPQVDAQGQGGLLDVALDPDFANNRMIYWVFSEPVSGGNHTAVAKGRLSSDEKMIENPTVIFRATPTYNGDKHYGSRLLFDKQGNIFFSTGERSDLATRLYAQKPDAYLGKIIHITKDGQPAADNPKISGWKPEIYSIGHRNPQSLDIDPATGELWELEHGPLGGDEINLIKPGKNYGWGDVTYGLEYSGAKIGAGIQQKEGTEQPVYYWDPVISPSGIAFYTGNIEEWKNNLFIGALSGQHIARIVLKNNKVIGEERLLADQNERFRDVLNGVDGNLYAITDSGKLYKISKK